MRRGLCHLFLALAAVSALARSLELEHVVEGKMTLKNLLDGGEKMLLGVTMSKPRQGELEDLLARVKEQVASRGWDVRTEVVMDYPLGDKEYSILFAYQDDAFYHYKGSALDEEGLITFIQELFNPQNVRIENEQEFKHFKESNDFAALLAVQQSNEQSELLKLNMALFNMSYRLPSAYVVIGSESDAAGTEWKNELATINLWDKEDNRMKNISAEYIREKGFKEVIPLLAELGRPLIERFPQSAAEVFKRQHDYIVFVFASLFSESSLVSPSLREHARLNFGRYTLCFVSHEEEEADGVRSFFGVQKEDALSLRGFAPLSQKQYRSTDGDGLSEDAQLEFLQNLVDGSLSPFRRSQPLSEEWDKNPVKVLVASNFEKEVKRKEVTALVLFHATWCGHCKRLMPAYDELAVRFLDDDSVLIAKIEATENDVETENKIEGFPTLILFRQNTNEEVLYNGGRSAQDLEDFIRQYHSTQEEESHSEREEL